MIHSKKIIIFGAGRIGRSFIGQVFNRSGYEGVFVDINQTLIDLLNRHRQYKVVVKGADEEQTLWIQPVRGVNLYDTDKVVGELANAGIAAFSVGQQGIQAAIPVIAQALMLRQKIYGDIPLDIIIAENMRHADVFVRGELKKNLPAGYPVERLVGLVETSIGKMVPIMTRKDMDEDPLQIFAEPYNTLIVDRKGFLNTLPDVSFLSPKDHIKAWVDRKLFIHNLGHATVAYLGFLAYPDANYIYEILEDKQIYRIAGQTMQQSAAILQAMYPGEFTLKELDDHIDDLLKRFRNRNLGDTVFRVGCDLYRKLGSEDRLAAPIHAAIRLSKPYHLILDVLKAGIQFRAKDENGNHLPTDELFFEEAQKGVREILKNICGIDI